MKIGVIVKDSQLFSNVETGLLSVVNYSRYSSVYDSILKDNSFLINNNDALSRLNQYSSRDDGEKFLLEEILYDEDVDKQIQKASGNCLYIVIGGQKIVHSI